VIWYALGKLLRACGNPEYRSALLRNRVVASVEHDRILANLGLKTIVDVGANRGQFALCARHLYPDAEIHCFEPLRGPAEVWRRTFRADPRAHLYRKAVAAQAGDAEMHVTRWDVSSSLLPIGAAQQSNFPLCTQAATEAVETVRLADCLAAAQIAAPALLKVDVQGFELEVLRGCGDLLHLFEFIYVEASFIELYVGQALASDVIAALLRVGFRMSCVANLCCGRDRRPIQADFLFSRAAA
jgi:FkbM family methyltransferase